MGTLLKNLAIIQIQDALRARFRSLSSLQNWMRRRVYKILQKMQENRELKKAMGQTRGISN